MHSNRRETIHNIRTHENPVIDRGLQKVSEIFGSQTFSLREMQSRLSTEDFESIKQVIQDGKKLDPNLAERLAEAVKSWAVSQSVTHFTHWFQPMTGQTAEKHDSFLAFDDAGEAIEKFSAAQLIQSEPDASSFPSGGMRSTFEARGYTAWDVSSPIFIVDQGGTRTLCIPSVFVSYTGYCLDTKTGLLRSIDVLCNAAVEMLGEMGEKNVARVIPTVGCEQEYFLIDSSFVDSRPDLMLAGRTLLGGDMPKGQELEDHYFGAIPTRVRAYMADAEAELYRLGVPVKTRHNEVAPSQFESAPVFEEANRAADHNMLTMEVLKRAAEKHRFVCLFHEKPFAGVNGSGKHCNWSMSTDSGENLLEPGKTPDTNFRFIAVLSCVLKAVQEAQVGLRAAIASHGNDHRLGANEAPPAILSVFLGSALSEIVDKLASGESVSKTSPEQALISFGLNRLPNIPKDNSDRNRTSPFAFTGNKFEFRAVGSSQAISFPMTILNAAVASAMKEFTARLREKKKDATSIESAALSVAKDFFKETKAIRFEGDNYSDEWKTEARERGLFNLLTTPEAYAEFMKPEQHAFLNEAGIYSAEEFEALVEVRLERYVKHLDVEAQTLMTLVRQQIIPAALCYQKQVAESIKSMESAGVEASLMNQKRLLGEVANLIDQTFHGLMRLQEELKRTEGLDETLQKAQNFAQQVLPLMVDLRTSCDKIEASIADDLWPLPKYREMLFIR